MANPDKPGGIKNWALTNTGQIPGLSWVFGQKLNPMKWLFGRKKPKQLPPAFRGGSTTRSYKEPSQDPAATIGATAVREALTPTISTPLATKSSAPSVTHTVSDAKPLVEILTRSDATPLVVTPSATPLVQNRRPGPNTPSLH